MVFYADSIKPESLIRLHGIVLADREGKHMYEENLMLLTVMDSATALRITSVYILVVGSRVARFNAAVQLRQNEAQDLLIVIEGLQMSTSVNTDSDKQTSYKLSRYVVEDDTPGIYAQSFLAEGSKHYDLAMVEHNLSA
jgi:hypothetical protein